MGIALFLKTLKFRKYKKCFELTKANFFISGEYFFNRRLFASERQGFGSFHCEDIDTLVRQVDSLYFPPPIYEKVWNSTNKHIMKYLERSDFTFGPTLKSTLFSLEKEWTFINHGAFGASLTPLVQESNMWRSICEAQPVRFFDRILLPMIEYSIRMMARFLNCPPTELLPVQSVSQGLNSIFNSLAIDLKKGHTVICFSLTYGSTKKMLKDLCIKTGASLRIVELPLPLLSSKDAVACLNSALSQNTKLVVIDQITSNTAINLPVAEMSKICKEVGAVVVIDAAHSLLSQSISIYPTKVSKLDVVKSEGRIATHNKVHTKSMSEIADFWITNGHKWFCSPKGCAYMWVSPSMHSRIRPVIISHGFDPHIVNGQTVPFSSPQKILSAFSWDGCRDYSALLTTSSALRLWDTIPPAGIESVRKYMYQTLKDAGELLSSEWNLEAENFAATPEMRSDCPMLLAPLPRYVRGKDTRIDNTDKEAFQLQELLHHQNSIEVPIKCVDGKLYVRISSHIYNTLEDYEHLGKVIVNI